MLPWTYPAQGVSQEKLAADAGVDRAYLGGLEREVDGLSVDLLTRLAAALQVPLAELFVEPAPGEGRPAPRGAGGGGSDNRWRWCG